MPSSESYTQVNPAGSGDKIRDLQITAQQTDGTVVTVKMQVVSIADADGNVLSFDSQAKRLDKIIDLLEQMRMLLYLSVDAFGVRQPELAMKDYKELFLFRTEGNGEGVS